MTIRVHDDAVMWVAAHPERFFHSGGVNAIELVQSLSADALLSGAQDIVVHQDGDIWVVASSTNWLAVPSLTIPDLFGRVVPHPGAGPNSMRSEVLLNAFCSDVVAVTSGSVAFVKGSATVKDSTDKVLAHNAILIAAVAFRLQGTAR
jgi:hypothetical protein